jgi:uncharacterized OB-fold protein
MMIENYQGTLPKPSPETQPFWDGTMAKKLVLPKCDDCGGWTYYPRPFCMHCFSKNVQWTEASGKGKLHTFAINYLPVKGFEDVGPAVIAIVELDEGPRMMTNLMIDGDPDPEAIALDSPVEITFRHVAEGITLPWFKLV